MSYSERSRQVHQQELHAIREGGLFKQERFIHSPQAADIEVEFPAGAELKNTFCVTREGAQGRDTSDQCAAGDGAEPDNALAHSRKRRSVAWSTIDCSWSYLVS